MTDEQLRAMLSRIRRAYKLMAFDSDGRTQRVYEMTTGFVVAKEADDAAVAIMREEMDRANEENQKAWAELFPFVPHTDDDPTKSFVATT